jgi:ABC-type transport system involved in cytochrome bd biosynthesis fused ATPase/permease subunit
LQAVLSTLTDSILLVIILAYSFYVNVTLTLLMVSIGMALTFFVSKGVRGVSNGATEARKLADEELKGWLIGLYRSFKQLHSLRLMDSFKISLGNVIFERSRAGKRQNFYTQVPRIVVENGVLLLIVVLMSFNSNLSGLLLVMPILIRAVPTTSRLNTSLSTLRFYSKEVTDVYLSLEDVSESNIDYLINTQYSRDMLKVEVFHIRFKGCDNLLQNKELYFVKGVVNFIVGASGTGKTTLVDMVVLDLMKNNSTVSISLIQQDAVMFNLSVFDNINFGRNISTERLKMINTGLGISDDLMNVIQSEGSQAVQLFSGGERQKINLARGLVSEADIYILDEPTNNLDEISKAKLIELLSEIAVESIVIVISHDNEFVSIFEKRKKVNIL